MDKEAKRVIDLLDSVRYVWLGTRRRSSRVRTIDCELAGWVADPTGLPLPFGEIVERLARAARSADMGPVERLVIDEFYGLASFPCGLESGRNPLVGRIRTSTSRRSDIASRSWIVAARQQGVEAIGSAIEPQRLIGGVSLAPVGDPMLDGRVVGRFQQEGLSDWMIAEMGLFTAHSIVDRADDSEPIRRALDAWAAVWTEFASPLLKGQVSYEARHSAYAALHVALWNAPLPPAVPNDEQIPPILLWSPSAIDVPRPGRVIETERRGVIDQTKMSSTDLVHLCGLIFAGDDTDGSIADFVLPVLVHSDHAPKLNAETRDLLVWAVGRHLASRGDWRAVDLAMSVAASDRRAQEVARHTAWAAHVASAFGHAGLGSRLINSAEQVINRTSQQIPVSTRRMVLQVRSGIAVARLTCFSG